VNKLALPLLMLTGLACQHSASTTDQTFSGLTRETLPQLTRHDFNRLASLSGVPLYWQAPALEPSSFVVLGVSTTRDAAPYIVNGAFTAQFDALYVRLVNQRRIEAVRTELSSGRLVGIITDLTEASEEDRRVVRAIADAGEIIEELYALQNGAARIGKTPADAPSRELLRRNQGYWCQGPQTSDDSFCHGLLSFDPPQSDAYPPDVDNFRAFCEQIRNAPNSSELMDPFSVVRRKDGSLIAIPYTEVYGDRMRAVAAALHRAAAALGPDEAAFAAYLGATAKGFETNNWDAADEAWVAMNSENSKWYLRIAPDEVYFDPCNSKAGFHVSFARINTSLLAWQKKLSPLRADMEGGLAKLIGPPYQAREVAFSLPDFIDIVLNAGDSRDSFGATIGQSLPNWGPVSDRGRTVVMTNLYDNPDSKAAAHRKAELLLSPETVAHMTEDPIATHLDILLHEATHNFGPHSDFRVDGKPPREVFGGLTASILEELKAQVGALWFIEFLRSRGVIDDELARATLTESIMWCFGQMSRGLFNRDGRHQVYPTIAAIQVGYYLDRGALTFDPDLDPDSSGDRGRFTIHFDELTTAVSDLMRRAGRTKANGDVAAAKDLIEPFTDKAGRDKIQLRLISERILRFPKESFSYAIQL